MQIHHTIILASLLTLPCNAASVAINPWSFGQGSPPNSGISTNSPVIGNGTFNSADDVAIYATLAGVPLDLQVGESLQFSGSMTLSGSASAANQFRFGLFSAADSSLTGWLGYMADNAITSTPGDLRERNSGNTGNYWLGNSATDVADSTMPGGAFSSGTYQFSLTLARQAGGLQIDWSLSRNGGGYAMNGSYFDSTPLSTSFNRAGILIGNGLDADQAGFSNLTLTHVPESHSAMLLGSTLLFGLMRRRRQP